MDETYPSDRIRWEGDSLEALHSAQKGILPDYDRPVTLRAIWMYSPTDYWKTLVDWWKYDDLIIVEHDIMPTAAHLDSLLQCDYPACTVPYMLDGQDRSSLFEFHDGTNRQYGMRAIPAFCDGSGIGLARLRLDAQEVVNIAAQPYGGHWSLNDYWISEELRRAGIPWHVHLPGVRHRDYEWPVGLQGVKDVRL